MGRRKYPIELTNKVLSEYQRGVCGYKLLAKKYDLKRDTIRGWVLSAAKKKKREEEKANAQAEKPAETADSQESVSQENSTQNTQT